MGLNIKDLTDFTIASSGSNSNSLDIADAEKLTIIAPASLTGTVTVNVSQDNSSFVPLQIGGSDLTIPAAKATEIELPAFRYIRLESSGSEAAERVFNVISLIRNSRIQ